MVIESSFQGKLIREIETLFPGCFVLKNDCNYIQGFPDLTILWKEKWATLECKRNGQSHHQPNQDWYVERLNDMGFSRFIFPENKDEVIEELKKHFGR